mgnify:FL=1
MRGLEGRITVTGSATHAVTVHTIDGRLIASFPAPASSASSPGTLSVDVAPGIYLVTVGSTTHKVVVR